MILIISPQALHARLAERRVPYFKVLSLKGVNQCRVAKQRSQDCFDGLLNNRLEGIAIGRETK